MAGRIVYGTSLVELALRDIVIEIETAEMQVTSLLSEYSFKMRCPS